MSQDIARIRGTRKTYLRNLQNQEKVILDIISNYSPNREQETILKAHKNSLLEKLDKLKICDDKILETLKDDEMENELEQILQRNDSFHHLTVKIDTCLFSQQTENSSGTLSNNSSKEPSGVKIKLPNIKITTFNGDMTTWQSFWDQYDSAIHCNNEMSDINKFIY